MSLVLTVRLTAFILEAEKVGERTCLVLLHVSPWAWSSPTGVLWSSWSKKLGNCYSNTSTRLSTFLVLIPIPGYWESASYLSLHKGVEFFHCYLFHNLRINQQDVGSLPQIVPGNRPIRNNCLLTEDYRQLPLFWYKFLGIRLYSQLY